jgi:hypothetical protein
LILFYTIDVHFQGFKSKLKLKILLNGFLSIHMNEKQQLVMIAMLLNGKIKIFFQF